MKTVGLTSNRRTQSLGEEIANSITHGVGLAASFVAFAILVLTPNAHRDRLQLIGVAVFGVTLILLYFASTIYHATPQSPRKKVLRAIDHGAIYLLIAGTYTPFTLGPLRGPVGWAILVTIWSLAILGIIAKSVYGFRYPRISTGFYLGMGWLIVLALRPMIHHVAPAGLLWLLAGGLCYTIGVVFYATDGRVKYGHTIWHCFVAAGSACHFFAVLWYASPAF